MSSSNPYSEGSVSSKLVIVFILLLLANVFSDPVPYSPIAISYSEDSATAPVEPISFDIRTTLYNWGEFRCLGVNLINEDTAAYDSLSLKVYFRGTQDEMLDLAIRSEFAFSYLATGFVDYSFKEQSDSVFQKKYPIKLEDTYDSQNDSYAWYIELPIAGVKMESGTRVRFDVAFVKRDMINDTLLNVPATYVPGDNDWSLRVHSTADGDPVNYSGALEGSKEDCDQYWTLETNRYITIHHKNNFVWGYSPSESEMSTKTTSTPIITKPKPFDQQSLDSATINISRIRVNQAGYRPGDEKHFYFISPENTSSPNTFTIIDVNEGSSAGSGPLFSTGYSLSSQIAVKGSNNAFLVAEGDTKYQITGEEVSGNVLQGVLPNLPEGSYAVKVGDIVSHSFVIDNDVYGMAKDAVLKFFGIQRCGSSDSWFHPACHIHDATPGGWHDCGDHLKEGITQSYATAMLGLSAAVFKNKDTDHYGSNHSETSVTDNIPDVLYEARHGADYLLGAYENASGDINTMITSIGNYSSENSWWGPPEMQENMPQNRGGMPREARNETGANIIADFCAGLAFVGKLHHHSNPTYADSCIKVAEKLYTHAKNNLEATESPAYNGNGMIHDELAFSAVALCWATENATYLNDLCYDTLVGDRGNSAFPKISFEGGWFAHENVMFGTSYNDWSSVHVPTLWAFYALILKDEQLCSSLLSQLGKTTEKNTLIEKTIYNLAYSLRHLTEGDSSIELPDDGLSFTGNSFFYDGLWKWQSVPTNWTANHFQMGNIIKMLCYADMAQWIQGKTLPHTSATTDWKGEQMKQLAVEAMDYMFGVNPWDVSMIYGIGQKNFNHPHHRASNPEGRNCFYDYSYRPPVGAVYGGTTPQNGLYEDHFDNYFQSEASLQSAALTQLAFMMLASDKEITTGVSARYSITYSQPHTITVRPTQKAIHLSTNISGPEKIIVDIFSINGKKIGTVCRELKGKSCRIPLSVFDKPLARGFYLVSVKIKEKSTVVPMTLLR